MQKSVDLYPNTEYFIRRASSRDSSRSQSPSNLCFDHSQMSKVHAVVTLDGDDVKIKDMNSSFGTVIDDGFLVPHQEYVLEDGDALGFIIYKSYDKIRNVLSTVDYNEGETIPLSAFDDPKIMLNFVVGLQKGNGKVILTLENDDYESGDVATSPAVQVVSGSDLESGSDSEPEVEIIEPLDDDSDAGTEIASGESWHGLIDSNRNYDSEEDDVSYIHEHISDIETDFSDEEADPTIEEIIKAKADAQNLRGPLEELFKRERENALVTYLTQPEEFADEVSASDSDPEDDESEFEGFDNDREALRSFYNRDFDDDSDDDYQEDDGTDDVVYYVLNDCCDDCQADEQETQDKLVKTPNKFQTALKTVGKEGAKALVYAVITIFALGIYGNMSKSK